MMSDVRISRMMKRQNEVQREILWLNSPFNHEFVWDEQKSVSSIEKKKEQERKRMRDRLGFSVPGTLNLFYQHEFGKEKERREEEREREGERKKSPGNKRWMQCLDEEKKPWTEDREKKPGVGVGATSLKPSRRTREDAFFFVCFSRVWSDDPWFSLPTTATKNQEKGSLTRMFLSLSSRVTWAECMSRNAHSLPLVVKARSQRIDKWGRKSSQTFIDEIPWGNFCSRDFSRCQKWRHAFGFNTFTLVIVAVSKN